MWHTDTYWFDVAVVASLLTLGSILFGRFEEHKPRWRRVLKVVLGVNGWTGEPRERYYALLGLDPAGRRRPGAG